MDTADICEEAHKKTVKECKRINIEVDATDENGEMIYTDKAQDIFNRHFNEIEEEAEEAGTRI